MKKGRAGKAAAAVLLGLLVLTQGGCEVKTQTVCERMLAYMSERYEDSFFRPVQYGGYAGAPVSQYYMSSEKLGDATVKVEVRGRGTKEERYLDDYMGVVYAARVEETLKSLMMKSFSLPGEEIVLMMEPALRGISDHWTPETTFEEYCADPAAGISFRAVIRIGEDHRDQLQRYVMEELLETGLGEAGICCSGWLYFVPGEEDISGINEETFFKRIAEYGSYDVRVFFTMKEAGVLDQCTWETRPRAGEDAALTAADDDD